MIKKILLFNILVFSSIITFAQIPAGYYDDTQGFGGEGLKTALYNIIKGHREYEYTTDTTDVWDILKETDRDPNNSANVICLYSGFSLDADLEYDGGDGWTREHVWAKSHGDFGTFMGPGTDVHHLRPADNTVNTARNNRWFAECSEEYIDDDGATGSYLSSTQWLWKPRDEVKGDVARMMFYMATRYEGENGEPDLELINYIPVDNNSPLPLHAKVSDLLLWNEQDPVDDWERNRNDIIFNDYQHNRNPFIDHPEWINMIWKNECVGIWYSSYPIKEVTDRESYSYTISGNGSLGTTIAISSDSTIPAWLTFTPLLNTVDTASASLVGSPALSDTGTYSIYLILTDGNDTTLQNFEIIVSDGNPIKFTSIPVTGAVEDELYSYNITATGDVGANFTLTGTKLPNWLSLTNNTGDEAVLTGTPSPADIGIDTVILTLTDDVSEKIIQQFFEINVLAYSDVNKIIISQYYEGASNDKYIEITNVGTKNVDLSDYYLGRWSTTDVPEGGFANGEALHGTILAGQTLVYQNSSASNPTYVIAYANTAATYYNGDDPVALTRYGDTWDDRVDCIYASITNGKWGAEKGFYRKADVSRGNKDMSVLDGSGEWIEISIAQADDATANTSEYLGYHICNAVNISEIDNKILVYPNPVENILYFETADEIKYVEIVSISGSVVISEEISNNSINVENLNNGLYIIKFTNHSGENFFLKFVK